MQTEASRAVILCVERTIIGSSLVVGNPLGKPKKLRKKENVKPDHICPSFTLFARGYQAAIRLEGYLFLGARVTRSVKREDSL
jgi:hypothetical protein